MSLMKLSILTVIVPRLPPSIDGLGDYGLILAKELRINYGVETRFIVADPNWEGEASIEGFSVRKLSSRTAASLIELLPDANSDHHRVLLHYVGYGYAKRGCPIWLINSLTNWRKTSQNKNLIVMFHELFAFGPIWTSQFWTSPLQRYLAAKLGLIADHCITSKSTYADIMKKYTRGKHSEIVVLPIFSNIGEPKKTMLLNERVKRLVIFGSKGPRSRVYQDSRAELERVCRHFEISEIFDIGPKLEMKIEAINGVSVDILGVKSAQEISEILSTTLIGFINYQTEYLAKSGIFASYCSHGLLPIAVWYEKQKVDAVILNTHYLIATEGFSLPKTMDEAQRVADQAYNWYQGHRLSSHAENFAKFIK